VGRIEANGGDCALAAAKSSSVTSSAGQFGDHILYIELFNVSSRSRPSSTPICFQLRNMDNILSKVATSGNNKWPPDRPRDSGGAQRANGDARDTVPGQKFEYGVRAFYIEVQAFAII
jgi:hypothetical protein